MKEFITSLVGKTLNLSNEQLAEIVYESDGTTIKADAIDKLVEIDAKRISTLKDAHKAELTTMHDTGYNKGKGETLAKFEKQLKDEFKVESDLKGVDLVKEIIAKNAKIDIDDEKVKLHPMFRSLETKLQSDYIPKADYEKIKGEFDTFKRQIEVAKTQAVVRQDGLKIFRSLNPVLSKDATKALNQENDFLDKLSSYNYEIQNDGNHVILKDGKRLETANGYAITFADFVKSEAQKYFDFNVQDDRGNSGNKNGGNNNITVPKSEAEMLQMASKEPDPTKARAIIEAWKKANGG